MPSQSKKDEVFFEKNNREVKSKKTLCRQTRRFPLYAPIKWKRWSLF